MTSFDEAYFRTAYRDYRAQNPEAKLAFYRRVVEEWAPPRRPLDLLDVGCGPGRFLAYLDRAGGVRPHGTDVSGWALERAREALPGAELRRASAAETPFPPASFDVVTALDVIEHVPERDRVEEAVAAMLRPGGLFVFVVPVYDGLSGPVIRLLDRDPTHVHKVGRSDWLAWAGERFRVLDWWGVVRYLFPGRFYLHRPTRRLRRHAPAILVAARRGDEARNGDRKGSG